MSEPPAKPERPGLFIAAILLHVVEGFIAVVLGTFGVLGLALTAAIVAASAHDDDAAIAVIAILCVMAFVALLVGVGLIKLFIAYKAWDMERPWIITLIILSVLTVALEPCAIIVAVLTVIGGMQALDARAGGAP